jgi:hypothetical protein
MTKRPPLRVFFGLIEVAGYYTRLAPAFRSAAVDATFLDLSFHRFSYKTATRSWWLVRVMAAAAGPTRWWMRLPARVVFWLAKLALFFWAVARFDVFVFSYGTTFFWLRELPLLRLIGKKIIFVFHGGDCRPPYLDGLDVRAAADIDDLAALTALRKQRVSYIERHAHVVVAPLTCAQFFEKPVVSFLAMGIPVAASAHESAAHGARARATRILHSPSDPVAKGTAVIRATVDELKARGHAIDYVELTGRPHDEIVRALGDCDFVIDQAYSDTPMPGLASEAARLRRPTVIGGYAWHETARFTPPEMMPPTVRSEPEDLAGAVESLITDPGRREAQGGAAFDFVNTHWRPELVLDRFVRLITGQPDPAWIADPRQLRYVWGAGMPRRMVAETIRSLVDRHGPSALRLDDKPELLARALEAARRGFDAVPSDLAAAPSLVHPS